MNNIFNKEVLIYDNNYNVMICKIEKKIKSGYICSNIIRFGFDRSFFEKKIGSKEQYIIKGKNIISKNTIDFDLIEKIINSIFSYNKNLSKSSLYLIRSKIITNKVKNYFKNQDIKDFIDSLIMLNKLE